MFITNKNIAESLVRCLQSSYSQQTNCEITLMCEGETLKCHRHVLMLHSIHLANLFKNEKDFPTLIAFVNMKFKHLKAMIEYMYFGKIKLHDDDLEEMQAIIKCAEDLGLSALVGFITDYVKTHSRLKLTGSLISSNGNTNKVTNGVTDDDSSIKRKRTAGDASVTKISGDSVKKPKLNEGDMNDPRPNRKEESLLASTPDIKSRSFSRTAKSDKDDNDPEDSIKDKKKRIDDDEQEDQRRKLLKEEEEKKRRAEEEERRRKKEEEEERQRKEQEAQKKREEERQRKAEEKKRIAEEEEKRKQAEEKKRKEEEEKARKAAEEEKKKLQSTLDEAASIKSCSVCSKQYKDNVEHKKVLDGVSFEKKCIMANCSKPVKFRRSLIDHLLKEHKIDVCDG